MNDLLSDFENSLDNFFINNNCKCSVRRYKHENDKFDYSVYVPSVKHDWSDVASVGEEKYNFSRSDLVAKLLQEAESWILKIKDAQISNEYLLVCLSKTEAFFHCFNEVLQLGNKYGTSSVYLGKKLSLTTDLEGDSPSTLTELRVKLLEKIFEKVLIAGGATVIDNCNDVSIDGRIHLGHKLFKKSLNFHESKSDKFILVAPVSKGHMSPTDYKKKRKDNLIIKNEDKSHRTDDELETLTDATIIFDLFKSKLSKPVRLIEHNEIDRGAVFALYNYARLKLILDTFEEKVATGYYPKLPHLQDLNFSLLLYDDEWKLVFDHILAWPSVISTILKSLRENDINCNHDCKIHSLVNFMQSLSFSVSSYYGRIQILREPRPQLLPYLFVRIYLLKVIIQVMDNCFTILGIEPLSRM